MKYNKLFEPIKIKNLKLKNKIVMLPIHLLYTPDGYATDRFNEFYWRRAEGGAGLIIVGGCSFDDYGKSTDMMSLASDDMIPGWKIFTDGMHERDTKVAVQLYHAGRYARSGNLEDDKSPIGPSPIFSKYSKETPKEMTIEDIELVKKKWAQGARRAVKAGFDAVEIVGSAGYLVSQFLSPLTNQRTDQYGGSLENRARFPSEVIKSMKKEIGDEIPIIVRLSGNDFVENSNTNSEAIKVAKILEKAGADLFNITGGWHETRIPQINSDVPAGGYTYLARNIKNNVDIPVIACNRINTPEKAEEILQLERGDLIGMGRSFIADPSWPNKVKENKEDEIKYCTGCNQGCLAKTFFGQPVTCLVNPEAGIEYKRDMKKISQSKENLLVIGGGVAGLDFAIRASELGHNITIWEKTNKLGGQLEYAAKPSSKHDFYKTLDYYKKNITNENINLVLNKDTTVEKVLEVKDDFDKIIIATGAKPKVIDSCIDNKKVISFVDVFEENVIPGKEVIVVGGGSIGCEVAMYLAQQGSLSPEELFFMMTQKSESIEDIQSMLNTTDRNITIIEQESRLGRGFDPGCGWPTLKEINRLGVISKLNSKIVEINLENLIYDVTLEDGSIERKDIAYDNIVLAIGSESRNDLYEDLKDKRVNVEIIGDAKNVGKILDATRDAMELVDEI